MTVRFARLPGSATMDRRLKIYCLSDAFLALGFASGASHRFRVVYGLPLDAEIVSAQHCENSIQVVVRSQKFDEVKFGDTPPFGVIQLQKLP